MAVNFLDPETLTVSSGAVKAKGALSSITRSGTSKAKVGSSKTATGVELRMLPPFIKDNHTPAVWPFPGYSKLYCLTIVVSDVSNESVGDIDLKGFQRIGDNEHLPINKTIYYWQGVKASEQGPDQIHVMCTVMKSKKALRDVGKILSTVKDDDEYKSLIKTLGTLTKDVAKFNLVTDVVVQVAGVVGRYLKDVEDKPLGTIINSYTTLHGDFDKLGISKLVYPTRDVDFEFEMVVRDASAEAAALKTISGNRSFSINKKTKINLSEQGDEKVEVDMMPL